MPKNVLYEGKFLTVLAFLCTRKSRFLSVYGEREGFVREELLPFVTHLDGDESCSTFVILVLLLLLLYIFRCFSEK